jgi:hypothetical protein
MYRASYNPRAMAYFFQKLEQKYGKGGAQLLSDHPNPGNRVAAVQTEIRNWPPKEYVTNSAEFPRVKTEAARTKAYSAQEIANGAKSGAWAEQNRRNGAIPAGLNTSSNEGNGSGAGSGTGSGTSSGASVTDVAYREVKPSGNFTRHEGQGFTIFYPDNWKVGGDQNSTLIAPPSGQAQNGISYGVIVGASAGDASSLDDATQELAQSLQKENPGLKISGQLKNVDLNGTQGRSLELSGNSPLLLNGEPLPERDWLVTVPRSQGGLQYLVFVSPERDFAQLRPTYQKMLESLQLR